MWHTHQPTGLSSCNTFLETVVQEPVIVVVQGALLYQQSLDLSQADQKRNKLGSGAVLAGPPAGSN